MFETVTPTDGLSDAGVWEVVVSLDRVSTKRSAFALGSVAGSCERGNKPSVS
jgi:hypothetical protein